MTDNITTHPSSRVAAAMAQHEHRTKTLNAYVDEMKALDTKVEKAIEALSVFTTDVFSAESISVRINDHTPLEDGPATDEEIQATVEATKEIEETISKLHNSLAKTKEEVRAILEQEKKPGFRDLVAKQSIALNNTLSELSDLISEIVDFNQKDASKPQNEAFLRHGEPYKAEFFRCAENALLAPRLEDRAVANTLRETFHQITSLGMVYEPFRQFRDLTARVR